MNYRLILNIVGISLLFLSFFMIFPLIVSFVYGETDGSHLLISLLITVTAGNSLYFFTRQTRREDISHREAFVIVTVTWLAMSLFGAIPYMFTAGFDSFTDAYFESMAGFTTTGSSILSDIESIPKGILFWRSMTQWIGGMGIIVLAIAILPLLGTGGMQLFKAEVPEISLDKLRPRILDTAKALWFIYVGLTGLNMLLLIFGGMSLFDACCHSFTTMATGGFSTKNSSIGHFSSAYIEYVTGIFMFLAGINYSIYFYVIKGKVSKLWQSSEFKFYFLITAMATFMLTLNLWRSSYASVEDSLRYAFFQVTSIMTTTGFATADFEKWSSFAQIMLVIAMFFGGMIGSTGGGIKQVRILLMLKHSYREIYQLIHPRAVTVVRLNDKYLDKEVLGSIWGFVFLFLGVSAVAIIGMAAIGLDMITSATTVISSVCNVGPALGEAGPADNYSSIPVAGKWILIFCMLTGRLEVYTVLILLVPRFWKA